MSIAQRGTTAGNLANSNTGYYSVDRFAWAENGDDATIRQSFNQTSDVPTGQGFSTSLKVTTTTASGSAPASDDYHRILHKIEAQNLQQLKFGTSNAEALTLSFWVKCSKTGTGVIFIYQDDSNQGVGGLTYTINSANTWEKKTVSIPANTSNTITNDNGNGLQLEFIFNAGSDFTGGSPTGNWETFSNSIRAVGQTFTINDTLNAYYAITGVQLEVGTSASDFEFLPYDVNLQRCQRYYQQYGASGENLHLVGVQNGTTSAARIGATLTRDLRTNGSTSTSGTIAVFNGVDVRNATAGTTRTTKYAIDIDVSWTGNMGAQGYTLLGYIGGNCTIKVDAEL